MCVFPCLLQLNTFSHISHLFVSSEDIHRKQDIVGAFLHFQIIITSCTSLNLSLPTIQWYIKYRKLCEHKNTKILLNLHSPVTSLLLARCVQRHHMRRLSKNDVLVQFFLMSNPWFWFLNETLNLENSLFQELTHHYIT